MQFLVLCFALLAVGVSSQCTQPRIRRNWNNMTITEQNLYVEALQVSMDRGWFIRFVDLHANSASEWGSCMYVYWHRYYLLGFENMLRSLGTKYECVTLPYWDYVTEYARSQAGLCTDINNCANVTRGLGGSTSGIQRSVEIYGRNVTGDFCVQNAPLNRFCQAYGINSIFCSYCLPRLNWSRRQLPPSAAFVNIFNSLFGPSVTNSSGLARALRDGVHYDMSNSLFTDTMFLIVPSDPIFYAHHAAVDLLQTINLKCRAGRLTTDFQKGTNIWSWVNCPFLDGSSSFAPTTFVKMNDMRGTPVYNTASPFYNFFNGIPPRYYLLSDTTTLPAAVAYSYQYTGLLATLYNGCTSAIMPTTIPALLEEGEDHDTKYDAGAEATKSWTAVSFNAIEAQNPSFTTEQILLEQEKMTCMFHEECRDGVKDYSPEFKTHIESSCQPTCKGIVDGIKSGTIKIALKNWRSLMGQYYLCDIPGKCDGKDKKSRN